MRSKRKDQETLLTLFQEDFFEPLRKDLQYLAQGRRTRNPDNLHDYGRVYITGKVTGSGGLGLKLQLRKEDYDYKTVDWDSSKRLIFGSLVILRNIHTNELVFLEVRDGSKLADGTVVVGFISTQDVSRNLPVDFFALYEAKAYWGAYQPVIKTLEKLRKVPFPSHIVEACNENIAPPIHLKENQECAANPHKEANPNSLNFLAQLLNFWKPDQNTHQDRYCSRRNEPKNNDPLKKTQICDQNRPLKWHPPTLCQYLVH